MAKEPLLPKYGGYRKLKSFQLARLVYDITVRFCDNYISIRSRTHDQMVQAARSGVQNIAEGSEASGTSKKFEIKLTNVARASLEELKLDYEDYLRQRGLELWERDDIFRQNLVDARCKTADEVAQWVVDNSGRYRLSKASGQTSTKSTVSTAVYPEMAANAAITLITVSQFLLQKQINHLTSDFEEHGGFTERIYRVRSERRK